jgi:starch phosphorylase
MRRTHQADGDVLRRVRQLADNLWWTWNPDVQRLFAALDPGLWATTHQSPTATLFRLPPERSTSLALDLDFLAHLERCEQNLARYLAHRPWFARVHGRRTKGPLVAYFCAEFGLHESLPIYCGGLGILAGDHLKAASDLGVPLVGVGLHYRRGYYRQELSADGRTRVLRERHPEHDLPLLDTGRKISVPMGRRRVRARIWQVQVGRVPLYLLDTDLGENRAPDRRLTDDLYGGDRVYRIEQEVLLGVGGMLALDALGLEPTVYHLNEGHAAFCALERLRRLVHAGLGPEQSRAEVRKHTIFTTHTPVPAGHDRFEPRLLLKYTGELGSQAGLSRHALLALGREVPDDDTESFCMTVLALKLAAHVNGVSELHGQVSRRMWMRVYGARRAAEVPIGHITNGVHPQSWIAPEMEPLYQRYLRPQWLDVEPSHDPWQRAARIPPEELWALRNLLRQRMIRMIRGRLVDQALRAHASADELAQAERALDEDALTLGFARRFATYKRAPLVFRDPGRLVRILGDAKRPVQLVFAGKAHPADEAGQSFVQKVYQETHRQGLRGRVVFVENYDIELGRILVSGCDVWLNNPTRPHEASGTSGMKPPLHGGLNCSVLDGWWPEAFDGKNGWQIGGGEEFGSASAQDRHDAECLYRLLEEAIVPAFYQRDRHGLPRRWLKMAAHSMASVPARFNTHRMVGEYVERYYLPAHQGKGV